MPCLILKTTLAINVALLLFLPSATKANENFTMSQAPYVDKIPVSINQIGVDWLKDKSIYINVNTSAKTRIPLEVLVGQLQTTGVEIMSDVDISDVFYSGEKIYAGESALSVLNKISKNTELAYRVEFPDGKEGVVVLSEKVAPVNTHTANEISETQELTIELSGGECFFPESSKNYAMQENKHFFRLKKGSLSENLLTLTNEGFIAYSLVIRVGHHMVFNDVCVYADTRDELVQQIIEPYYSPKPIFFGTFTNKVAAIFYEGDPLFAKYFRGRK